MAKRKQECTCFSDSVFSTRSKFLQYLWSWRNQTHRLCLFLGLFWCKMSFWDFLDLGVTIQITPKSHMYEICGVPWGCGWFSYLFLFLFILSFFTFLWKRHLLNWVLAEDFNYYLSSNGCFIKIHKTRIYISYLSRVLYWIINNRCDKLFDFNGKLHIDFHKQSNSTYLILRFWIIFYQIW